MAPNIPFILTTTRFASQVEKSCVTQWRDFNLINNFVFLSSVEDVASHAVVFRRVVFHSVKYDSPKNDCVGGYRRCGSWLIYN